MKPVPRWFVAVSWALAVLFMFCVGLQVNDPDPVLWMAMYGVAGVVAGLLPARRVLAGPGIAVGLIAAGWGAYLGSQVVDTIGAGDLFSKMSEKGGAVETGREAGGLAIIAIGMLVLSAYRATRD